MQQRKQSQWLEEELDKHILSHSNNKDNNLSGYNKN